MANPQPPPTSGVEQILPTTVGPTIGGVGFPLGFSSETEEWNPVATYRGAMLDEAVDDVKFLRMQVKCQVLSKSVFGGASDMAQLGVEIPLQPAEVLSMSGVDGSSDMAQLGAETPLQPAKEEASEAKNEPRFWGEYLNDGTEWQAVKFMEGGISTAMQFLWSKALCIAPIFLATAIYHVHHQQSIPPLMKIRSVDAPS